MLPDVGVASLKQLGVNPSARSKHGGARTGRGRDSAVTRPGVAGPALPRRPDPRVEIEQEGRSRAGREGLGWSTQAAESGVRAGRDGEEQKDEERGGPAPRLESGEEKERYRSREERQDLLSLGWALETRPSASVQLQTRSFSRQPCFTAGIAP